MSHLYPRLTIRTGIPIDYESVRRLISRFMSRGYSIPLGVGHFYLYHDTDSRLILDDNWGPKEEFEKQLNDASHGDLGLGLSVDFYKSDEIISITLFEDCILIFQEDDFPLLPGTDKIDCSILESRVRQILIETFGSFDIISSSASE